MRTWIEIDIPALVHNLSIYRAQCENARLCLVIKGNAYGHDLKTMSTIVNDIDSVDMVATASTQEAVHAYNYGCKKNILALSILDEYLQVAISYKIHIVAYDYHSLDIIVNAARTLHVQAYVHLKLDTGLNRLGLKLSEFLAFVRHARTYQEIVIVGLFSHFANSEQRDQEFAYAQLQTFKHAINILHAQGYAIPYTHISCSASTLIHTYDPLFTMVRIGIGAYGLWPSPENKQYALANNIHQELIPILSWYTTIIQIKEIEPGESVGYNRTFIATERRRIALLPIGYWDGYDRRLSNNSWVRIHDKYAPIVGIVAMNLIMIDITYIPEASRGTQVILIGPYPLINPSEIALRCSTISYEITTRINSDIPRVAVQQPNCYTTKENPAIISIATQPFLSI
ncbi:hypothetical protein J120_04475 [candidate division TM6 bacterium JCVI TM6SC1]|uniref:Alanine racemase n=1 Tax=candidate division TM6 bacterium JCVI TM6SC1 TaxID=1306947 RepID=A0A0D2I163_9BACT|nr:hypothetical protein J120_04475 [candidate division TM6 bacterium JCVI TM6SC1]